MRKIKLIMTIFVIIFALIMSGCSQKDIENPDQTDSSSETEHTPIIEHVFPRPSDTYKKSKNVYEGILIEFDEEAIGKYKDVKIKVNITRTFKGDNIPGEIVEDYLCYRAINTSLEKNTTYLFMTMGDPCDDHHQYSPWCFHAVPLENENKKRGELIHSYLDKWGDDLSTYDDLIYDMLSLDEVEYNNSFDFYGDAKGFDVAHASHEGYYRNNYMDLGQFFVLADNVYIGEEIEWELFKDKEIGELGKIIVEGYDSLGDGALICKAKIRVVDVIKGNFKPGDIIIDVPTTVYDGGTNVYFSGDAFYEGYDELVQMARESLTEETTNE